MDKGDVIWRLAELASFDYQSRYIIGGTKDEYRLTSELLQDVFDIDRIINLAAFRTEFSRHQLDALQDLHCFLDQNFDAAMAGDTREEHYNNIRHGTAWADLRAKAATALNLLGVDPHQLTVDDIDRLSD
tara:strand:+ start:2436 stop:2825 length:390 start_codon:yes stop_codon:yes gene_type:complete